MTHSDQDHSGGLQAVIEQFPVNALLINGSLDDKPSIINLMTTAISKNIPIYSVYRGMKLQPDSKTAIEFLYPLPQSEVRDQIPFIDEQNEQSIVFRMDMEGASFLFAGDISTKIEQRIVDLENQNKLLDNQHEQQQKHQLQQGIHMMKAAHHGSKSSTSLEWVTYWNPDLALISAGKSNIYGHPHQSVVDRLNQQGVDIYRTDQQGEVQIQVRDGQIWIRNKMTY